MTEIETPRLLLRTWRDTDLDPYSRICDDPEVMRYVGGTKTPEECAAFIKRMDRHWRERGYGLWVVEEKSSGRMAGFTGLVYQDDWPVGEDRTEVGWRLGREFWGRGVATEAALESVRYGFEALGLRRIISMTVEENTRSCRVIEKAGLTRRGKTNWRDSEVVWYAMDRKG